jgi:hypothetical protein
MKTTTAKRCLGYTVSGKRCKKTTSDEHGRCPQHQDARTTPRHSAPRPRNSTRRVTFEEDREQDTFEHREPIENLMPSINLNSEFDGDEGNMDLSELEHEAILCLAREAARRGALVIMYRE